MHAITPVVAGMLALVQLLSTTPRRELREMVDVAYNRTDLAEQLPFETDPYLPTKIDINEKYSPSRSSLQLGQTQQLNARLTPINAITGLRWASSDPRIVEVDAYGLVRPVDKGTATITATTCNGLCAEVEITVTNSVEDLIGALTYRKTADQKGIEITGCDAGLYRAHIPAEIDGLPVVAIKPQAFADCANLTEFTVDPKQKQFYAEGGVLFTDKPTKTLVCFPPGYADTNYTVPDGTVEIAAGAFAGICARMRTITIPEGVTTMGDGAFARAAWQITIYVPDTLTKIGSGLLQGQTSNVPFYGSSRETAFAKYAEKNQIPYNTTQKVTIPAQTVQTNKPTFLAPAKIGQVSEASVYSAPYDTSRMTHALTYQRGMDLHFYYDFSTMQGQGHSEVRVALGDIWSMIIPDQNGDIRADFAPMTGLYGAGYTAEPAVLRAYDRDGELIGGININGNFAFAFPGAHFLGVEGGRGTALTALPLEPVYVSSPGILHMDTDNWYTLPDGRLVQYYILHAPAMTQRVDCPNYLSNYSHSILDTATNNSEPRNPARYAHYLLQTYLMQATTNIARFNTQTYMEFDQMSVLYDDSAFACYMAEGINYPKTFGEDCLAILNRVKQEMRGDYLPVSFPIGKITAICDNSYPSATSNVIMLDDIVIENNNKLAVAHELIHAIDNGSDAVNKVAPGTWLEGRAELISELVCAKDGRDFESTYDYDYKYDWSFLTAEDRADFFNYYYFRTNRYTEYPIGYYFLCFITRTYGDDVSARIMARIAALEDYDSRQRSEANALLFLQCVEAETAVGVFDRFVREVIEQ